MGRIEGPARLACSITLFGKCKHADSLSLLWPDLATGRDPARVKIFDTTLRDGEQSPGASLTGEEKLILAKQLAKLGVDIIEAGFPIASVGDFEAVKTIAQTVGCRDDPPIICGLSRARKVGHDSCSWLVGAVLLLRWMKQCT